MSNREWALLAFKLLGVWFLASAAIGAANTPYLWDSTPEEVRSRTVAFLLLPSLVAVGIGTPLWFSADWFARRIFPGAAPLDTPATLGACAGPLFALAISVLGVFLVADGVPGLASSLYLFTESRRTGILGPDVERQRLLWDASAKANAVAGVVRLLIGVALLAGPARLSAAFGRVRRDLKGSLEEGEPPGTRPPS